MEELLSRHRKEARDLTARITQKKKAATKKTRRGTLAECEALERELQERQAREVAALGGGVGEAEGEEEREEAAGPPEEEAAEVPAAAPPPTKKPSRQKARLARRAASLAALSSTAANEATTLPDRRATELTAMSTLLASLNLTEHSIPPDGHCLYSAFADQLPDAGLDYRKARVACAGYMAAHPEQFEAFVEGGFEEHVRRVRETAEWGGQTEVVALARAFGVVVNVVQAEGRVERMGEEDGKEGGEEKEGEEEKEEKEEKEVWLGYYRFAYGLGEHYNSLRKKGG